MGSFRTSSVFKFTKDFELLKKIIRDGVIPNYCEENLSFEDGTEFCVGIPMASFCDIPITLLDEHNKRYGNYGIALKKEWAIEKGLTPVMYIANYDILKSVHYYHQHNEKELNWFKREDVRKKMIEDTIFRGFPLEDYAKMMNAKQEHSLNTHIIGYLKKYEGEFADDDIINYEENEWRFIVPDEDGTRWFWSKEDYMSWRNPLGKKISEVKKPSPSEGMRHYTLKFTPGDISYILLKDDEFKKKVIEFIKKLKMIGGNKIADEKDKDDLISKIVTLDQVKNDF